MIVNNRNLREEKHAVPGPHTSLPNVEITAFPESTLEDPRRGGEGKGGCPWGHALSPRVPEKVSEPLPGRELTARVSRVLGPLIKCAPKLGPFRKLPKPPCPHAVPILQGVRSQITPVRASSGPVTLMLRAWQRLLLTWGRAPRSLASWPPPLPTLTAQPAPLSPSRAHVHPPGAGAFLGHVQSCRPLLGAGGEPDDLRIELLEDVW